MRFTTLSARRIAPTSVYGPEVARAVVLQPTRHVHARERLLDRDLDVRIRLVVAQRDVEARLVLLDQVRLEDERVRLGRARRSSRGRATCCISRARLRARRRDPARSSCARATAGAWPCPRTAPALGVLPQVDAGRLGQVRELAGDGVGTARSSRRSTRGVGRVSARRAPPPSPCAVTRVPVAGPAGRGSAVAAPRARRAASVRCRDRPCAKVPSTSSADEQRRERRERAPHAPRRRGRERGGEPQSTATARRRDARRPDARAAAAAQERELDPARDARRRREARGAPACGRARARAAAGTRRASRGRSSARRARARTAAASACPCSA